MSDTEDVQEDINNSREDEMNLLDLRQLPEDCIYTSECWFTILSGSLREFPNALERVNVNEITVQQNSTQTLSRQTQK